MFYDGNGFERLMEIKMDKVKVATIYNRSVQSKAEMREEGKDALERFLKAGGVIQVGKPARAKKSKMSGKTSRGFQSGTSGFATGFPRGSAGFGK